MYFTREFQQQYRDADEDGLIGARSFFCYLQDAGSHFLYNLGLGNDRLPEERNLVWIYVRYRIHIWKKADFVSPLSITTWVEADDKTILLTQGTRVFRGDELFATGRVQSCLVHFSDKSLARLSDVGFPYECGEPERLDLPFSRLKYNPDEFVARYEHVVRYGELDKSRHLTNLRYVELFLNAYDSEFHRRRRVVDMELQFKSQALEGEVLRVEERADGNESTLAALHADGTVAALCRVAFQNSL